MDDKVRKPLAVASTPSDRTIERWEDEGGALTSRTEKLNPTLYCSFCGKTQHEVQKLVAGPDVFICNECVDLCNKTIGAAGTPAP